MKANERFLAAARGKKTDRLPMIEWATWWTATLDRWKVTHPRIKDLDEQQLHGHFGLDIHLQHWFPHKTAQTPVPASSGAPCARGRSEYLDIKATLFPEPRLSREWLSKAERLHRDGSGIVWFTIEGFFWFPRTIFGIEDHLYAFYDEPELYKEMCEDLIDWQKKVIRYCTDHFDFDFMTFAEDMSYNLGPMVSKDIFDEFMAPYYREIVPLIKRHGILTAVDSDGDITKAVGWFHEVGIEAMLPLERQAGVDVRLYQDLHPDMCFIGHFDKMVMNKGEAALRNEFERLLPAMIRGRFIPSVDHQTPPAVSYDDYTLYVRLLKEYCEKAAAQKA